eukprot:TRINITY_DN43962_c0_g4_i1.p2 TRINITY_DN43962_c0_g4~~TRINITY_DN43962_c0_g4_i1.p2  ORF type:complete len:224 (-),score=14.25 TRINITY_DN43962_c0_g4_i1:101-772(-)
MAPKRRRVGKLQRACAKTRLCLYYTGDAASCRAGEHCLFAHSVEELCEAPDLAGTSMCHSYAQGSCEAGTNCSFAHGEGVRRPWPTAAPPQALARDLQNDVRSRASGAAAPFGCNSGEQQSSSSSAMLPLPAYRRVEEGAGSSHRGQVQAGSLPFIPYRVDHASSSSSALRSLLAWPAEEREVAHISGHRVYRKNTFLIVADSARQGDEFRRCWSVPWARWFE